MIRVIDALGSEIHCVSPDNLSTIYYGQYGNPIDISIGIGSFGQPLLFFDDNKPITLYEYLEKLKNQIKYLDRSIKLDNILKEKSDI